MLPVALVGLGTWLAQSATLAVVVPPVVEAARTTPLKFSKAPSTGKGGNDLLPSIDFVISSGQTRLLQG